MGIDFHALNFLCYASKAAPFGDVLTIGRQWLYAPLRQIQRRFPHATAAISEKYCEELLTRCFQAQQVESIDVSAYEQATIIHDLNHVIPDKLVKRFDTIIDCGSSEHIFDIAQVFRNYGAMARPGAQLLHVLPTNNFCGHGFWQISPELFFSLYSPVNGFRDTEVFVARVDSRSRWFRVRRPPGGQRVNIVSKSPLHVLARTFRTDDPLPLVLKPQQSDYVHLWNTRSTPAAAPSSLRLFMRRAASTVPGARTWIDVFRRERWRMQDRLRFRYLTRLNFLNPFLERVNIDRLCGDR